METEATAEDALEVLEMAKGMEVEEDGEEEGEVEGTLRALEATWFLTQES